ncbi:cell division protein FtsQ/DivIB [Haliea sp. E1-2-M8]|uniref:cell division protein FtsQ/DivIB n=1 Tax=Haliea sp. E1-2-M8 TaxID=3064706 RepID=UPI0027243366|nr:cell division protein FtsQ/DivIB [Haliea sp. E1-2-M8]MDO8861399.1 cell division protein FtsQ/DivIB [Haliea sp. E1-2-M8]
MAEPRTSANPRAAGKVRRRSAAGATRRRPAPAPRSGVRARLGLRLLDGWVNRMLILVAVGVVGVAGLQAWIALQEIPVERISVTGTLHRTQTEAVQEMVQPALVGGFLSADLDQVQAQLQALPWIYRVSVRRRWPNALEINVQEQLPIARWGEGGYLNHEGEIFHSDGIQSEEALPRLEGPPGSTRQLIVSYQQLGELLQPLSLDLRELSLDDRGHLRAVLAGGMELVLGNTEFGERLQRFATVYRSELAERAGDVKRVDLRYESGLAVAFREPELPAGEVPGAQVAGIVND